MESLIQMNRRFHLWKSPLLVPLVQTFIHILFMGCCCTFHYRKFHSESITGVTDSHGSVVCNVNFKSFKTRALGELRPLPRLNTSNTDFECNEKKICWKNSWSKMAIQISSKIESSVPYAVVGIS